MKLGTNNLLISLCYCLNPPYEYIVHLLVHVIALFCSSALYHF